MSQRSSQRSLFQPSIPSKRGQLHRWCGLHGAAGGVLLAEVVRNHNGPLLIVTNDMAQAYRIESDLRFFCDSRWPVALFPDWETLPYDQFTPHQDIISQRIETLYRLPQMSRGALIVAATTLVQRLSPRSFLDAHSLAIDPGDRIDPEAMRVRLEAAGYQCVSQVAEHGEFAVRGALIDLYPMGAELPYRIELFDDEVETIRTFDPESQRTSEQVGSARLLPAREFPLDEEGIGRFRGAYRTLFEGDPGRSQIYREVSAGRPPAGVEYYLPLFFEQTETLFDYLPETTLVVTMPNLEQSIGRFSELVATRHQRYGIDPQRPLVPPDLLYLSADGLNQLLAERTRCELHSEQCEGDSSYATEAPPSLVLNERSEEPAARLIEFIENFDGSLLFSVESSGRREALLERLGSWGIRPALVDDWAGFINDRPSIAITIAPLEHGLLSDRLAIIAESQLYGERVLQRRRRQRRERDSESVVRDLGELSIGSAVVHEEHGVGRYLGLQRIATGGSENEYLTLEYAGGAKLYVPVASLQLISRYSGADPEAAPLHRLGSDQWSRARRKAAEKIRDVAVELLDLYARREARPGKSLACDSHDLAAFAATFPFEETPDQMQAIESVLADLASPRPMDRVVCGDVGFGKTEVAMRAAFAVASSGRQVALLVPTTLLAQQHDQNFSDRFADWPIRVESLSRFTTRKAQAPILEGLASGTIDIVIGTHKLIGKDVRFKDLGLVIVDEEHRFGVRQKEALKSLRAEVDILTLTATPIPRTLSMAMSGLRDLSLIATPPERRLAVKTFVGEWDRLLIQEACERELKRGGQIYFVHNRVEDIERVAHELEEIVPNATLRIAHGQMRERELEAVMSDFYHQRFNILVATTIIESGIDVPTANTILINRADRFGLAQLHQMRGRVGRSHHRAYAYLIIPSRRSLTADAVKRLEAIESLEELGAGFLLASHDLEIRGAGELLGEGQSGQIDEIGFTLYASMLERAVAALRSGRQPELEQPASHGCEVELGLPALIPDDYLPDVHTRLVLYKRIASATDEEALTELQIEMIDRFGLLPEQCKNLFAATRIRQRATRLDLQRIEVGANGGRLLFGEKPQIDAAGLIALIQTRPDEFRLDGQERLRLLKPVEGREARVALVEELLDALTPGGAGQKAG